MSTSILERLNERIAVEPALDHLDTLFVDLQDARDAIIAAAELSQHWKDAEAAREAAAAAAPPPSPIPASVSSSIEQVHTLLIEAKERLSVHALTTVDEYLDRALKILED